MNRAIELLRAIEHLSRIRAHLSVGDTENGDTIQVCARCGEERERAEFYDEPCRGEPDGSDYPNPVVGDHEWVTVDAADGPEPREKHWTDAWGKDESPWAVNE